MACPTCSHTMQSIVVPVFWCPRCGTVLTNAGEDLYVPKLVERVREYAARLDYCIVTEGEDSGMFLLSEESPTKYDATLKCHVYLHDHFSPLGDHLVRLHSDMVETVGPKDGV